MSHAETIARVYREEWTRIVATLIRMTGDWDVAEEATADAFERAARRWETDGVPRNPGAWLTTVAKHRALDGISGCEVSILPAAVRRVGIPCENKEDKQCNT